MSFQREQKRLGEILSFNPPPGYYEAQQSSLTGKQTTSFAKGQRFIEKVENSKTPGPGAYATPHANQYARRRMLEESQRKEIKQAENSQANIKISSIPSIPKKSATRVYEELAPGILILHEEEYENTNIGPGSYNINERLTQKKTVTHKIPPPPLPKAIAEEPEVQVPTLAEEIRNEKRLLYKQNLIKASTVNKSEINPSDLCLEVIILREKLLRDDENPSPGHYYNEQVYSSFKKPAEDRPVESQLMQGKEERFKDIAGNLKLNSNVGPGAYSLSEEGGYESKGGFIPKEPRKINSIQAEEKPGPGAYIVQSINETHVEPKGNYPPIFGSGSMRFASAPKQIETLPGPGAYHIGSKRPKKVKYIKIKKTLLESMNSNATRQPEPNVAGINAELYRSEQHNHSLNQNKTEKNTHNFSSNVSRFLPVGHQNEQIGPGQYESNNQMASRRVKEYSGDRGTRFSDTMTRPKVGPGSYNAKVDMIKEKRIMNVFM